MERVEQVKQSFVDFMEQNKQHNSLLSSWNPSGEALSNSTSSVVMSSDGNFPHNAHRDAQYSSIACESSTQSGPLLKEHDYIGLGEVSSASSSVSGEDAASDVEDTDLRLGRGRPGLEDSSQQKAQPLFELEILEPKEKAPLAFRDGFTSATVGLHAKNGFKRAYGEALGNVMPVVNMVSTIIAPFKHSQGADFHGQQNVYLSNWPAPISGLLYTSTDGQELQNFELASAEPPPAKDQVVGWPPIRSYRRNTLTISQTQPVLDGEGYPAVYVKVNMDGLPIGRKVDLTLYDSYQSLSAALEEMFYCASSANSAHFLIKGEFALTYEDKDGDWMLVGDVPWRMFVNTVRRLRIVRGAEANGLAPRRQI